MITSEESWGKKVEGITGGTYEKEMEWTTARSCDKKMIGCIL